MLCMHLSRSLLEKVYVFMQNLSGSQSAAAKRRSFTHIIHILCMFSAGPLWRS